MSCSDIVRMVTVTVIVAGECVGRQQVMLRVMLRVRVRVMDRPDAAVASACDPQPRASAGTAPPMVGRLSSSSQYPASTQPVPSQYPARATPWAIAS